MIHRLRSRPGPRWCAAAAFAATALFAWVAPAGVQPPQPVYAEGESDLPNRCLGNLRLRGVLADILANALRADFGINTAATELRGGGRDTRGEPLFQEVVATYSLDPEKLKESIRRHQHVNCTHGPVDNTATDAELARWKPAPGAEQQPAAPGPAAVAQPPDAAAVSAFARDVTLHVVLHEMGHALIREFDIPVLGNEETVADAFATHYLTTHLPDRALDVLTARTTSLMIEAGQTPDVDWRGEHDDDARRAYQIAAIAVAADPVKYKPVADAVGMSAEEITKAADYGGEIHRSWRRILAPLWMPQGAESAEARVTYDDGDALLTRLCEDGPSGAAGLAREIEAAIKRFDWHSQVTVSFASGDGRAGWNRSRRTVTVHSAYVRRFIEQGASRLPAPN